MKRVLITIITSVLAIILFAGCVLAATGKVNEGEVNGLIEMTISVYPSTIVTVVSYKL